MTVMHYLAYGSNLHPYRLTMRVSSAKPIAVVPLDRQQLVFHKRSRFGSGKCMLAPGAASDIAYGVLYEFDSREQAGLNKAEGVGLGYLAQQCLVPVNGDTYNAYMYVAHSDYIDTSLSPVDWYKEMVVLGAEYHKLPQGYIESIRSVPSSVEARPAEVAQELKTLEQMRLINKSLT